MRADRWHRLHVGRRVAGGVVSPSTTKPQDAYRIHGHWICQVCGTHDKGGQEEFYRHWFREHFVPPKDAS